MVVELFNCRSLEYSMFHVGAFSNPWVLGGVPAMTALQMAYTYWPPMNRRFGSEAIDREEWLLILAVTAATYAVVGFEKWIGCRRSRADS